MGGDAGFRGVSMTQYTKQGYVWLESSLELQVVRSQSSWFLLGRTYIKRMHSGVFVERISSLWTSAGRHPRRTKVPGSLNRGHSTSRYDHVEYI
jgi:hypothetical protein